MPLLYWITGSVTASRKTCAFMALAAADTETGAIGDLSKALSTDWASFEIDAIRPIDPDRAYEVEPQLREAIHFALNEGVYLFVSEQPASN